MTSIAAVAPPARRRRPKPAVAAVAPSLGRRSPQPPVALYVHVPFCLSVCPYCDFVVYGGHTASRSPRGLIEPLVEALEEEIRLRGRHAAAASVTPRPPLESVYVGGGTPSLLAAREVGRVLDAAARGFGIARGAEVTLEVNPGAADRGDLRGFRAAGVTRLSVGAQSMRGRELRALGRRHGADDVVATVRQARAAGFDNVGLDLLYDVPGQSLEDWQQSLDAALALEPDHVSAYALALDTSAAGSAAAGAADQLPPRAGATRWRRHAAGGQDEDRAAAMYELADSRLEAAGLEWYEISNWARPGRQSRHNLAYWRSLPHEAVGPGAHAFDGALHRRWNGARIDAYLAALVPAGGEQPQLPPGGSETLAPPVAAAEDAILRLRTRHGLDAVAADDPALGDALDWASRHGLTQTSSEGTVSLTLRGRLLANELFVRLLPPAPAAA